MNTGKPNGKNGHSGPVEVEEKYKGAIIEKDDQIEEVTGLHEVAMKSLAEGKSILKIVSDQISHDSDTMEALTRPERVERARARRAMRRRK